MVGLGRLALAGVMAVALAPRAMAADWLKSMVEPAPEVALNADPVELGTGWYLRGDAGVGFDSIPKISGSATNKNDLSAWSVDLGVGYKVNNWLRFDIGFDMRKPQNNTVSTLKLADGVSNITCPYLLQGLTAQGSGTLLGYLWADQAGTCQQKTTSDLRSLALMLNGYVDLGTWNGVTPYVGAGVGVSRLTSSASVNYYKTSDGSLYAADLTPTGSYPLIWIDQFGNVVGGSIANQPTIPYTKVPVTFAKQNWTQVANSTRYNFAWSLMAGVAYALNDRAKLDIGFRYMNLGQYQPLPGSTAAGSGTVSVKEVKVGVRYMID